MSSDSDYRWLEDDIIHNEAEPIKITKQMYLFWLIREDIQRYCTLNDRDGRLTFFSCYLFLQKQMNSENAIVPSNEQIAFLFSSMENIYQEPPYLITRLMYGLWRGLGLNEQFDLSTQQGRILLWGWSNYWGALLLPENMQSIVGSLMSEASTLSDNASNFPLTLGMEAVWWGRPDLQQAFDIAAEEGMQQYISWILRGEGGEHPLFCLSEDILSGLLDPEPSLRQTINDPWVINRYIYHFWCGSEIKQQYDINDMEDRKRIKGHFYYFTLPGLPPLLQQKLMEQLNADLASAGIEDRWTFLTELTWWARPDLQQAFDIHSDSGYAQLHQWCLEYGTQELPHLFSCVYDHLDGLKVAESEVKQNDSLTINDLGVNVVGFAKGELGIGEDVRMAAMALERQKIPFSVFNAPLDLSSRADDSHVDKYCLQYLRYQANLICLPGFETIRLFLNLGKSSWGPHYNIGAWQWELPHWPDSMHIAYHLVDELWVSSQYTADAFRPSSPVPVRIMPMTVQIETSDTASRDQYGLSNDDFVFLFIFDFFSGHARKNPLAPIKAFRSAFPQSQKGVKLVLKTMNASETDPIWLGIMQNALEDPRIILMNQTMDRKDVVGLIQCSDAIVSLHRAEGFGRTLAEAMLLGKPVIATNFSGNTDFCRNDTALLVNGPMIPVKEGEYRFWEKQYWCDPDIQEAAIQMRRCIDDCEGVRSIAEKGKALIESAYSADAVGQAYKKRLDALVQEGNLPKPKK